MKLFFTLLYSLLLFGTLNCGNLNLGDSTSSPNDAAPSGTIIAQSQFTSQNGATVSGAARIYRTQTLSYILRLEGISVPSETGLQVIVNTTAGAQVGAFSLRSSTGSQNYTLSLAPGAPAQFSSVFIYSTQKNQNYGAALFQQLMSIFWQF